MLCGLFSTCLKMLYASVFIVLRVSAAVDDTAASQQQLASSYVTSDDITSHATYATSLEKFLQIEKEMFRIQERASFHSFVHLIPPVLELIHAENVLEIGTDAFYFLYYYSSIYICMAVCMFS
jgi:hypothetical protein